MLATTTAIDAHADAELGRDGAADRSRARI
jgi:hypothetical protein